MIRLIYNLFKIVLNLYFQAPAANLVLFSDIIEEFESELHSKVNSNLNGPNKAKIEVILIQCLC